MGGAVYQFEYDRETGTISDKSTLVGVPQAEGMPDGLTVDADGYIWVALYGGRSVVRFAPDGTEDRRIELPTQDVTSLAFGGPSLSDLYVTTAAHRADDDPDAGALFRLSLDDVSGRDGFTSSVSL